MFISLKQGNMSVSEYEEQFTALSRFALDLERTRELSVEDFSKGWGWVFDFESQFFK